MAASGVFAFCTPFSNHMFFTLRDFGLSVLRTIRIIGNFLTNTGIYNDGRFYYALFRGARIGGLL